MAHNSHSLMSVLPSICSRCRKVKTNDCEVCKPKPFTNINKDNYSFYNSRQWRTISKAIRTANPLCVICLQEGRTTPSQVTDHIIPIDKGGSRLDSNNLQAICHRCHNKKTGKSR